jgi:hypothetical protein
MAASAYVSIHCKCGKSSAVLKVHMAAHNPSMVASVYTVNVENPRQFSGRMRQLPTLPCLHLHIYIKYLYTVNLEHLPQSSSSQGVCGSFLRFHGCICISIHHKCGHLQLSGSAALRVHVAAPNPSMAASAYLYTVNVDHPRQSSSSQGVLYVAYVYTVNFEVTQPSATRRSSVYICILMHCTF